MEEHRDGPGSRPSQLIPLSQIDPDSSLQVRASGISEAHVHLLMESNPDEWPPCIVAPMGDGTFGLVDGEHRFTAAQRLDLPALRCFVIEGAGYAEAIAANIRHGLPLSKADRKDAARWYAYYHPDMSWLEISRRVGLSDKTVKAAVTKADQQPSERRKPSPMSRLVMTAWQLYDDPNLSTDDLIDALDSFDADDRPFAAAAFDVIGHAMIEAAAAVLKEGVSMA